MLSLKSGLELERVVMAYTDMITRAEEIATVQLIRIRATTRPKAMSVELSRDKRGDMTTLMTRYTSVVIETMRSELLHLR